MSTKDNQALSETPRLSAKEPREEEPRGGEISGRFLRLLEEDRTWVRDYKNHQENILYSRINIFIVVSAILIAGFVGVLEVSTPDLRYHVAWLGLGVAGLWIVVILRQWRVTRHLRDLLKVSDPLYRKMKNHRAEKDSRLTKLLSGQAMLFIFLPAIFALFWIFALFSLRLITG